MIYILGLILLPTSDVDRLAGHRHRRFLERLAMRRVGVAGVGDVLAVAPNSIACAAWAIIVPATEAMHHTPSTRSVLASAMTFTKPSGSWLVLARLLASIGNLPILTSPCSLACSSVRPTPAISGMV